MHYRTVLARGLAERAAFAIYEIGSGQAIVTPFEEKCGSCWVLSAFAPSPRRQEVVKGFLLLHFDCKHLSDSFVAHLRIQDLKMVHFWRVTYVACLFCLDHYLVQAQTVQSIIWNVPNGNLPDLSQNFTDGTTLALSWNGWTSPDYLNAELYLLDLWNTAYNYNKNPFSQLLIESINLTIAGTYPWTISVPDNDVGISGQYVLRFKIHASAYDPTAAELSSPGFYINIATPQSSSISTSIITVTSPTSTVTITLRPPTFASLTSSISPTSSTSSTASPSTSISTSSSPSSSTASTVSASSSLSPGATAGIGVGATIAFLALVGLAIFFFIRKRRSREIPPEPNVQQPDINSEESRGKPMIHPVELPTNTNWNKAELAGSQGWG